MSALTRLGISIEEVARTVDPPYSASQEQTRQSFSFKWAKRDTYESPAVKEAGRKWLLERYCEDDPARLEEWLTGGRKIILDAGCGSGYSAILFFGDHLKRHDYLGVDISDAVNVARARFYELGYPAEFLQRSVTDLPIAPGTVDLIFSEGVLHHTDNTGHAIRYLSALLKPGGRFLFYMYAKKAVIREFTDDHIRQYLSTLSDEQAWEALKPLTKLGQALAELHVTVDVPEDIPYLGVRKGSVDLQRFFYWSICKAFYRHDFTLDENNHLNFDWFRPLNCHRHTPEEVVQFCHESGLAIEHMNVQESGITIVSMKQV